MEWKEILDKLRGTPVSGEITKMDQLLYHILKEVLQKLASEEAKKPEEPVKEEFRLTKFHSQYNFKDDEDDDCLMGRNAWGQLLFGVCGNCMCLTQDMVKALLPLLQEFVEKGEIG